MNPPHEHSENVARHFAKDWQAYDRQIRQVIPYYDQALTTMVDVIAATCPKPRLILDLGIGTGNLASLLLSTFPDARLVGVDILQGFIDQAAQRIGQYGDRMSLFCADVADFEFESDYDIVVSSFMFHHLDNALKRELLVRIQETLTIDGCFVNLDFVHSGSSFYARKFDDLRIKGMKTQGVSEDRYLPFGLSLRKNGQWVVQSTTLSWLPGESNAGTQARSSPAVILYDGSGALLSFTFQVGE